MDENSQNTAQAVNPEPPKEISETETLKAQLTESQSKYMYLYAEFENYKKRAIRERSDLLKFGFENAAREIVGVVDNFERALNHATHQNLSKDSNKEVGKEVGGLIEGLKMVHSQLMAALAKQGVLPLETVGKAFDPNFHEAVGQEQTGKESSLETVVREEQKGYLIHGRLLRPARVILGSAVDKPQNGTIVN